MTFKLLNNLHFDPCPNIVPPYCSFEFKAGLEQTESLTERHTVGREREIGSQKHIYLTSGACMLSPFHYDSQFTLMKYNI